MQHFKIRPFYYKDGTQKKKFDKEINLKIIDTPKADINQKDYKNFKKVFMK